jgi:hypothetical protein
VKTLACLQASVNLATETALVKVMVPKGAAGQAALKKMGETLAQVGSEGSVLQRCDMAHNPGGFWGRVQCCGFGVDMCAGGAK